MSMTDVVDKKTGSEMSHLAIDFFRGMLCRVMGCTVLGVKAAALGVAWWETGGGIGLAEKGGIGDVGVGYPWLAGL